MVVDLFRALIVDPFVRSPQPADYDKYLDALASYLNSSSTPPSITVDIDITRSGGYVKHTLAIKLPEFAQPTGNPIICIWSDRDPKTPFVPTSRKQPIAVEHLVGELIFMKRKIE
jgi:hypothetical protein